MNARPSDQELSGITVNERLFTCGLEARWSAAVVGRKKDEMIAVLCEIAISKEDATRTAEMILANPSYYGF